jgi:hypothetical protein
MFDAIGKAGVHGCSAEMEIRFTRMAHRPAAYLVAQVEQAGFVRNFGAWFRRYEATRRRWRDRRLLITGSLTQEAARSDRHDLWQVWRWVRYRLGRNG